jgi:hypothetical protein
MTRAFIATLVAVLTLGAASLARAEAVDYRDLAPPVVEGRWLRPADADLAVPRWGHAEGLQVGISPLPGPRGLLRVYAPYLGQPDPVMINFIAIEPIPQGEVERGLSELEHSQLDDVRGKRIWSADDLEDRTPRSPERAARGRITTIEGVEGLQVFILVEPFENGADVAVRLTFRADRPHEVGIATYAHASSVDLEHCIATATMGNYARLRKLHLADRVVHANDLWPGYEGNDFAPHRRFALSELTRASDGEAIVTATPDEASPQSAEYAEGTRRHWHYQGRLARQSWRVVDPGARLQALVNGRRVYWGSRSPIPGGVSFENFELVAPFKQGGEFWFGVEPME